MSGIRQVTEPKVRTGGTKDKVPELQFDLHRRPCSAIFELRCHGRRPPAMNDRKIAAITRGAQWQLDKLRVDFENACRRGERPRIETYLTRVSADQRHDVLFELLRIEAELHPNADRIQQAAEYISRFPDYADLVNQVMANAQELTHTVDEQTREDNDVESAVITAMDGSCVSHSYVQRIPGQYIIGSDASADIVLPECQTLSKRHACLILEPAVWCIVDLNSSTGTHVNRQRIDASRITSDDEIQCGESVLKLHRREAVASIKTEQWHVGLQDTLRITESETPCIQGYRLERLVGKGAFGAVYEARQLGTNRQFAIKTLLPEYSGDDRMRALFMREASIASQLKHDYIIAYHGFGISGSTPYLVMEYVPCDDLVAVAAGTAEKRRTRMIVKAMLRILEALQYAHEQGVVHRDVKLSNILAYKVDGRLHVKLSDFGLSKFYATAGYSGVTGSEMICGTLIYMSPEQLADSKYAKPPCDVYAAIVCLYRLLTGVFPHSESTPAKLIHARMNQPPVPIQELNPAVPLELAAIVERGLDADSSRRYSDAATLIDALRISSL